MSNSKLKKQIEENGGFKHWFVNVFWYHYRWPLLVGIVILGIIIFITADSLKRERYDTTVVIATDYYVDEANLTALNDVLEPVVEDLDGNGQVNICYVVLYADPDTEVGRQNQERMYLYMTQEDVAMYLMSENISDGYTNPLLEYFVDDVADYGLTPDGDNTVRTSLVGNTVLEACGMEDMYFSIMDFSKVKGGAELRDARDTAINMVNALIEAGTPQE